MFGPFEAYDVSFLAADKLAQEAIDDPSPVFASVRAQAAQAHAILALAAAVRLVNITLTEIRDGVQEQRT